MTIGIIALIILVAVVSYWAGKLRTIFLLKDIIEQAPEPMRSRLLEVLRELEKRKDSVRAQSGA